MNSIAFVLGMMGVTESGAQVWTNLGNGMEHYVEALAFDSSGNLYAGGEFTNAGGVAVNCIAKWNGVAWSGLGSGINGASDLALYNTARATRLFRRT